MPQLAIARTSKPTQPESPPTAIQQGPLARDGLPEVDQPVVSGVAPSPPEDPSSTPSRGCSLGELSNRTDFATASADQCSYRRMARAPEAQARCRPVRFDSPVGSIVMSVRHCYDARRRRKVTVDESDGLTRGLQEHPAHLQAVAYRMLGSLSAQGGVVPCGRVSRPQRAGVRAGAPSRCGGRRCEWMAGRGA
jgi:hypothetical protein